MNMKGLNCMARECKSLYN
uniref:Uncharacterized protein n=1 Tax=Rhizophora mucronata TaxID=61149 RepID=A0A2P2NX42_RHIMU